MVSPDGRRRPRRAGARRLLRAKLSIAWGRSIMRQLRNCVGFCLLVLVSTALPARAADQPNAALSDYFPPPEEQGGWRSLLPAEGEPDDSQKARIRAVGGVDWDALKAAWDH